MFLWSITRRKYRLIIDVVIPTAFDERERAESIKLDLKDPIGAVEWLQTGAEADGARMSGM
jgi:hypothetical protein